MFRYVFVSGVVILAVMTLVCSVDICRAQQPDPQAPATVSWLPHGYGNQMYVNNTLCTLQKGLHGFRTSPTHIGCWSQPLWGWDVNGYFRGPQVPIPDPAVCQLPIGMIYPENTPRPPMAPGMGPMY